MKYLPRISTDDDLEDAWESRAFFKGRCTTSFPFLMARLTTFAAFFEDAAVLEEMERMEGDEFRWLIVDGELKLLVDK